MTRSAYDLEVMQSAYEYCSDPLRDIAKRLRVDASLMSYHAKRRGWVRCPERPASTFVDLTAVRGDWDNGVPIDQMARDHGVSRDRMRQLVARFPRRKRPAMSGSPRTGTDWTIVAQDRLFPGKSYHELSHAERNEAIALARELAGVPALGTRKEKKAAHRGPHVAHCTCCSCTAKKRASAA